MAMQGQFLNLGLVMFTDLTMLARYAKDATDLDVRL